MFFSRIFEKGKIQTLLSRLQMASDERQQHLLVRELAQFERTALPYTLEALLNKKLHPSKAFLVVRAIYSPDLVAEIIPLLGVRNGEVSECGYELIRRLARKEAIPYLIEALRQQNIQMTKNAVRLIKELGDARVVQAAQTLFRDTNDRGVRRGVLEITCHFSDRQQVPPLILEALQDKDWWIRLQAVDFLREFPVPEAVNALMKALQDSDNEVRGRSVDALAEIGGSQAVKSLLGLLRDRDLVIRQKAVEALSMIADISILPDLVELMKDDDVNTRRCTAEIINALRDPQTGQALLKILRDEDWWVREIAVEALIEIKSERIIQILIDWLQDKDLNLRRSIVEIFGKVKIPAVVEPLLKLLEDEDWWVRERAVAALGNIGDKRAIQPLISQGRHPELRWVVAQALGNFSGSEVENALISLAQDPQKGVRREAAVSLGKLRTERAIAVLKMMLGDEDTEIQLKAADLLKQITSQNFPTGKPIVTQGEIPFHESPMAFREGTILTEAIVVMDICNSTGIAAKYGDNFALQMTKQVVSLIEPLLKKYKVQYMKSTGDGYLLTFPQVESAVGIAIEMLRKTAKYNQSVSEEKQLKLRFAINFGETRIDAKRDRLGVATNMTFRMESIRQESLVELAEGVQREDIPLETRILLSESVYDQLRQRGEDSRCTFLGYFEPKGILGKHKVFQLHWEREI